MNFPFYLEKFNRASGQLNRAQFEQENLDYRVGIWLNSIVLKLQKKTWVNPSPTGKPFGEGIFESIWVYEELPESRLHYNIHALKLRQLTGYKIKSRDFAADFRSRFKVFEKHWPNVTVDHGPLTLMEGWMSFNEKNVESLIIRLADQFLQIAYIIDNLLEERKKPG